MSSKGKRAKERKMNKGLKIFLITLLVLVIIIAGIVTAGYLFVKGKLDKIKIEEIDESAIGIDNDVAKGLKGYRNIAILGIDTRADDYSLGNRSDCIIVASLNEKTKEIRLISVYRDTYVNVENHGNTYLDKITHAYSYGGAQNTLKSLNEALDLNIDEYVTVNFDAVVAAVDELGGIYIDVDSAELEYINGYIDGTSSTTGVQSSHITNTGKQKLDGVQAVAYSRIRYTDGGDYKRTERMREVIMAMLDRAKTLSLGELNSFVDNVLPLVRTNIKANEIIALAPSIATYKISSSIGWPYDVQGITLDRWYGVPVTLESNVIRLHEEAFGQKDYKVSDTVKEMSEEIIEVTGYTNNDIQE